MKKVSYAHDRDRTCDRWLIRPMLYQLSYASWYDMQRDSNSQPSGLESDALPIDILLLRC